MGRMVCDLQPMINFDYCSDDDHCFKHDQLCFRIALTDVTTSVKFAAIVFRVFESIPSIANP